MRLKSWIDVTVGDSPETLGLYSTASSEGHVAIYSRLYMYSYGRVAKDVVRQIHVRQASSFPSWFRTYCTVQ